MNVDYPWHEEIRYVAFNQDHGCFACGTTKGFRIYNTDPYKETFTREFPNGGIGIVEMLFRCNILALVGGGKVPCFPPTKVMLWDDHQSICIGELTFKSDVRAVKLRRDKVVVVLEHQVYVYSFEKLELIHKYDTVSNIKGLCALSPSTENCVLACPHNARGQLRVENFTLGRTIFIEAHESNVNCMALNAQGTRLATASEKGTLIRIWDTATGAKVGEVRRGADRAEIYSINFSPNSQFIVVSSDKGTVHVFSTVPGKNRESKFSLFGPLVPQYFNSEWSFAWWKGPEIPMICCFGQDNASVIASTSDGSYYKLSFDAEKGGECEQKQYFRFLKV